MADSVDVIQERLLGNIPDTYDKNEGQAIYDIEKPIAIELHNLDTKSDEILNNIFADTATSDYLDRKVFEQGLTRKSATKSTGIVTITGSVGAIITSGEMVASDSVNFIFLENAVIPANGTININVECEEYGTIGNVPIGSIKYFPKTLEGLQTVTNAEAFTNGYEEETDEELRSRYYDKIQAPATSGNKNHYINWAKEVTGVGDARCVPLWNGNGTVKVIIINSNKREADSTLITNVVDYIEDVRPIGATVTVISATEKAININVTLTIDTANYTLAGVKASIENTITNYLKTVAFVDSYISYAKIGNIIFEIDGVLDYTALTINNGTANISIADSEVAVLGVVTIG